MVDRPAVPKVEVAAEPEVEVHLVPNLRAMQPHEAGAGLSGEDGGVAPVEAVPHGDVTRETRRVKGAAPPSAVPVGHRRLRATADLVPAPRRMGRAEVHLGGAVR